MNKAIIMGRLTRDPELRTLQDNVSVCSATVAVDRRTRGQNGEKQADFIRVTFWRQQAEFVARYFSKGSRIAISGRIQVSSYEDASGQKRTSTEIVAEDVEFVDPKQSGDSSGQESHPYESRNGGFSRPAATPARPAQESGFVPTPDDDISLPFDLDP
ncbi:MAG: single-stranded DNA-binding protein [Clostridia bacterium]|nr:single-stranded DNA-binding protein [Clostridia bacterium]